MNRYKARLLRKTYYCLMFLTGLMIGLNMAVQATGLPWIPPAMAFVLAMLCARQAMQ